MAIKCVQYKRPNASASRSTENTKVKIMFFLIILVAFETVITGEGLY